MKIQFPRSITYFNYISFLALFLILGGCEDLLNDQLYPLDEGGALNGDWGADYLADGSRTYNGSGCSDCYPGTEKFGELTYNEFVYTTEDNLSTFGIDVDKGSYTFGRKKINEGQLPPNESVRIEEYINYFRQDYEPPLDVPFSVHADGAPSPFRVPIRRSSRGPAPMPPRSRGSSGAVPVGQ